MKVYYKYKTYDYSPEATSWSQRAGVVSAAGFPFMILAAFAGYYLVGKSAAGAVIGFAVGIAAVILFGRHCKKKEIECALRDGMRAKAGREMTEEEMKTVRKILK